MNYTIPLRLVALSTPRYRPEPYAAARGRELSSSSSMVPKAGPITVPAWDQESRDTSALTPEEYARLRIRVRVGGELSYTKMLAGWGSGGAESQPDSTGLSPDRGPREGADSRPATG